MLWFKIEFSESSFQDQGMNQRIEIARGKLIPLF